MLPNKARKPLCLAAALLLLCSGAAAEDAGITIGTIQEQVTADEAEAHPLTLRPESNKATQQPNGLWVVPLASTDHQLWMKWSSTIPLSNYTLQLLDKNGKQLYQGIGWSSNGCIDVKPEYFGQTLTVVLRGYSAEKSRYYTEQVQLRIDVSTTDPYQPAQPDNSEGSQPDGNPNGSGSSRPNFGGFGGLGSLAGLFGGRGGSGSAAMGVMPGVGIGSGHADGNGSMQRYNTVSIAPADGSMTELTLDGVQLPVQLTNGEPFTATAADSTLILTPEAPADGWQIDGHALTLLQRSGVDILCLTLNGESLDLPTDYEPQGIVYTQLRVDGCTPADFVWTLTPDSITAAVDGRTYTLQDDCLRPEED